MTRRADEEAAARERGRREAHLAEGVHPQHLELLSGADDDESGRFYLISPEIAVAADGPGSLMFEHYFLTESGYDGGNLMISINGGAFTPIPPLAYDVVPRNAFVHNPYNAALNDLVDQNTNPKRGEDAFTGANPISGDNNWGQSQVDLAAAGVAAGDTIRLRWDFGQDGCNGNDGWYVDNVEVFTCGDDGPPPPPPQECTDYPANMPIPEHPSIKFLGYVDEPTRDALLSAAAALVVPSPYESLSIVLLEAWNRGTPAVVNGSCDVLRGQAIRSDGALYYRTYDEFARAADYLLGNPEVARQLGANGRAYVDREYRWPVVMERLEQFLAAL